MSEKVTAKYEPSDETDYTRQRPVVLYIGDHQQIRLTEAEAAALLADMEWVVRGKV